MAATHHQQFRYRSTTTNELGGGGGWGGGGVSGLGGRGSCGSTQLQFSYLRTTTILFILAMTFLDGQTIFRAAAAAAAVAFLERGTLTVAAAATVAMAATHNRQLGFGDGGAQL